MERLAWIAVVVLVGAGCGDDGSAGSPDAGVVPPPECGDSVVDSNEVCDDGNTASGDGCSSDCASDETCGNEIVDPNEDCDDGNAVSGDGCNACVAECVVGANYATLQAAINDAACATIWVAGGTFTGTTTIARNVDVIALPDRVAILNGDGAGSVVTVTAGNVSLTGLTLTNGSADRGGALHHSGGTLALTDVTLEKCVSVIEGGGLYSDGAVTCTRCRILDNQNLGSQATFTARGGGVSLAASAVATFTNSLIEGNLGYSAYDNSEDSVSFGGGIYNAGTLTLDATRVTRNAAVALEDEFTQDDIRSQGGGIYSLGTLVVYRSSIDQNLSLSADWTDGAGIFVAGGSAGINTTVVYGNDSVQGRGGGITIEGGTVVVRSATIVDNRGAGLSSFLSDADVRNSVVRDNDLNDCNFTIGEVSSGYNNWGTTNCTFTGTTADDDVGGTPILCPFFDWGGPTPSVALSGSDTSLIDAGEPGCADHLGTPLTTDQRGLPRVVGSACDVGAFEVQATPACDIGGTSGP